MTSSFTIQNLMNQKQAWTYAATPNAPLGGLEDRYIRLNGNCHPNFVSVPIGNVYGAQMCVRKPDTNATSPACANTSEIGDTMFRKSEEVIQNSQGYHRGMTNLYDVKQRLPTQQINPQFYSDRRTPYDADLVRRDYLHHQLNYNGTGIKTLRTPHQLEDAAAPYWEYDFSFLPREDPQTGMRTATSWSQTVPPPKWDITKLHQTYPVFKREHEYLGHPQNFRDTTYNKRIV